MSLQLATTVRGRPCSITVSVVPNLHPIDVGTGPHARGFPVCTATIQTELAGYGAVMGWIQFVAAGRPDASAAEFELDPLEIHRDVASPYAFHGIAPTLFDAPSRRDRSQTLSWSAHSFLCVGEPSPMSRRTAAVAGFSWGFDMSPEITIHRPAALDSTRWSDRLPLLQTSFPTWEFVAADPGW